MCLIPDLMIPFLKDDLPRRLNVGRQIAAKSGRPGGDFACHLAFHAYQLDLVSFAWLHFKVGVAGINLWLEAGEESIFTAWPTNLDLSARYALASAIAHIHPQ